MSGCTACEERGSFNVKVFCDSCMVKVNGEDAIDDIELVKTLSEKLFNENFPERRKRLHDSNSSQDSGEPDLKVNVF